MGPQEEPFMSKPTLLVMSRAIAAMARPSPGDYDILALDEAEDHDALLHERGAGIRAVLCAGMERLDAARLALLPDLELIAVIAAGYAGVDVETARARGIAVTNAGSLNSGDVADYAVTLMLGHRRDLIANDRYVRDDKWPARRLPSGRSIARDKVGIVGLGHIGVAIAERLSPFGCDIAWWGPRAKLSKWPRVETLVGLAEWASVLMIAARGEEDTRGLVDADVIAALGADGLIVNVSRGFVIDEPAMIAALRAGTLGGAALDVFDHEPIAGSRYADVPGLIMAPHVAGATEDALAAVIAAALDNIRRLFAGETLLNRVA
jgi:lactate dehydrogenase-like 2-hydroxyacid dehydrogenase